VQLTSAEQYYVQTTYMKKQEEAQITLQKAHHKHLITTKFPPFRAGEGREWGRATNTNYRGRICCICFCLSR